MLTWPQSARNPIFEDLNFKDFTGQGRMPLDPLKETAFRSLYLKVGKPFSKMLYLPQLFQGTNCNVCIE